MCSLFAVSISPSLSPASTPTCLLDALARRLQSEPNLAGIRLHHLNLEGPVPHLSFPKQIRSNCFFISENMRSAIASHQADYIPIFLSDLPILFRRKRLKLDLALITISPFDEFGYASVGTSCDATLSAVENAAHVIAVINPSQPRTHGRSAIHVEHIHTLVSPTADSGPITSTWTLPSSVACVPPSTTSPEGTIGKLLAQMIPDGAWLVLFAACLSLPFSFPSSFLVIWHLSRWSS